MDDAETNLSFDFENTTLEPPGAPQRPSPAPGRGVAAGNRKSFRTLVCRHWLRSLCMKGDSCLFLHQYDKSKMPICRYFRLFGECPEQVCVYKHSLEDINECSMYKMGFCPNGPNCKYRHGKLPGPPPPVEEIMQKIQQLASNNDGDSNMFFQNRNANYGQQTEKSQFQLGPTSMTNVDRNSMVETSNGHQQATPLPQGTSRYFVVKSCNRENLELSVQQGVWATQRSNEARLNEAFESVNNVILIFSVNQTGHFQGCAKMTTTIGGYVGGGNWNVTALYGTNFAVKWLKLCELSFHKTRHLRNPFNENLPVKISRDCQELEPSVGEQLASLLYLEPDSDLMAISIAAESKREEEKAKGGNLVNLDENPDIVPCEDNEEEEEEEESEEEDISFGQAQGRRRGRGLMWPLPHLPVARGVRPFPGMQGFPQNTVGPDGFSGFPMPDSFAFGPCGFGPYAPRFPGGFPRPGPGMMFPARPPGGYGMMIGPRRAPFMAGMVPGLARAGRPVGRPPFYSPPSSNPLQNSSQVNRDQKGVSDKSHVEGAYQRGKGQNEDRYRSGNIYMNDESESEDEAPRRSPHVKCKKKQRSLESGYDSGSDKAM